MLPKSLVPMELKVKEKPFDSPSHLFQVKWDGVRCLAYLEPNRTELINRRLNYRTKCYPELVRELAGLPATGVILDGEIVALDAAGKPNFRQVLKRDLVKSETKAVGLSRRIPVNYLVFDLLYYQGKSICHLPLTKRQQILTETFQPLAGSQLVRPVESFPTNGIALYQAVEQEGLEGIVAKEVASPYILGEKSSYWYKIKCWRQLQAVVCGVLVKQNHLRSLLLAAYEEEQLIYIGNVASGLTEEQRKLLLGYSKNSKLTNSPVVNPPTNPAGEITWVKPELVVLIKYLEWSNDLKLRSPFIEAFLAESPESCNLSL